MTRTFSDVLCSATHLFRRVLQFVVILLVLLALSFVFVEPGSASYYMAILNLFVLIPLLVASGGIIYHCKHNRGQKKVSSVERAEERGETGGE